MYWCAFFRKKAIFTHLVINQTKMNTKVYCFRCQWNTLLFITHYTLHYILFSSLCRCLRDTNLFRFSVLDKGSLLHHTARLIAKYKNEQQNILALLYLFHRCSNETLQSCTFLCIHIYKLTVLLRKVLLH